MSASELEPLMPNASAPGLADLALTFEREAAALGSLLHPDVAEGITDLLRIANSYYSNRIEGNDTTPAGIEAAMRQEWADDPARRSLQRQALAHVEVERVADEWLHDDAARHPLDADTLSALHRAFFEPVAPADRWVAHPDGTRVAIVPGALRVFDVRVGHHVAPAHASLPALLDRAATVYDPARLHGLERSLAFAASHHRLLWIHPFGDGNGRVVRLASRLFARAVGIGGTGLWTPSRGLARDRDRYMAAVGLADLPRRDDPDDLGADSDALGALSAEGLTAFTRYFLERCLDQVRDMREVLALPALGARLDDYVARRRAGLLPGAGDPLSGAAAPLLRHCLLSGRVRRGDIPAITGRSARATTTLVGQLLAEGLLRTDSPKGAVRLGLPLHALRYLLPDLYPEGADRWSATAPATTWP